MENRQNFIQGLRSATNRLSDISGRLMQITASKTPKQQKPLTGEVISAKSSKTVDAIVDESWVEEQIAKMKTLCDQVEKKHNLPPSDLALDGREFYQYMFPNQLTDKCPVCQHEFGKFLQRATYCPECHSYLRVRYGFLLSDENEKKALEVQRLSNLLARYRTIEPDSIRTCARYGMDDTIRQIINDFAKAIEPYL